MSTRFGSSTISGLPSHFATSCARMPSVWREKTGWRSSSCAKRNVRKEDRVKQILTKRGNHPGLVGILSAMEPCSTYKPWHNKNTGKTYLLPDDGKCLH